MRRIILTLCIPALLFITSCGGSEEGGIMDQMKKMKEISENAQEMEKELVEDPEASDKMFSDSFLEDLGLNVTERKISDEDWAKSMEVIDAYLALDSTDLVNMDHEKATAFFMEYGYDSLDVALNDLQRIADEARFVQDIAITIMGLQQTRLIDGKEVYLEETKEFGQKINDLGYTADDLRALETNLDYTGKALGILLILNNFQDVAV